MRILSYVLALVVMLPAASANAQTVTGSWQGTLNAGRELRVVITVTNAASGLAATFYSIDQGSQGMPASTVTLQGTSFRLTIAGINGTYAGTLSSDSNTITGTWTQGGPSLPLNLTRAMPDTAWKLPEPPKPMATDVPAVFEVATIKPSVPDRPGKLFTVKGRQVLTINTTITDLITFAYGLHARQISGGPAWIGSEKYDVTGQPAAQGLPNVLQMRQMIQQLLADRLKLAFHRENRELPVYAITVAGGGPRLTKNDSNPNGLPGLLFRGLGTLPGTNATIADLAGVMQTAVLDRPVVDKTGLPGRYDFVLTWTPDETQFASMGVRVPPPPADGSGPPGLFTAFQEQLGLKLESTKAPAEVLVIDRLDKPSEN